MRTTGRQALPTRVKVRRGLSQLVGALWRGAVA